MKLQKLFQIFIVFFLINLAISARRRSKSFSRGKYSGLSQIGDNIGKGLSSLFSEEPEK